MTTMLEFYQRHAISPVKQAVADFKAHFARRAALYRQLGLPPMAVTGKAVLEVGPGTGENALYTASLDPRHYALSEPNEAARDHLSDLLPRAKNIGITSASVEQLPAQFHYDLVLCEGLLGLCGDDPKVLLEAVFRHVKIGGVLVITCIDAISDCAEVLRRGLAHQLIDASWPLDKQVDTLRPVFAPHLATLTGMTRSVEDWIIDNLLNPASIGPTFSIPKALQQLDGRAELLGCSPRFLVDWRWYKESTPGNQWAIDCYWRNAHNLYDYRTVKPERSEQENRDLMDQCLKVRDEVAAIERGEYQTTLEFHDIGWFGRGQQYLSFVRVQ